MIYFFFKPLKIKEQEFIDVPLFELSSFTLYELNRERLETIMHGTKTVRYSNRYTVKDVNYTDNSKEYIANMRANDATYQDDIIKLNGNVVYKREDGLSFETKKVVYNKKTNIAYTDDNYISYFEGNTIKGSSLEYNNLTKQTDSTYVNVTYNLKGR
jgi:LPS export ABC transporter protein LptC